MKINNLAGLSRFASSADKLDYSNLVFRARTLTDTQIVEVPFIPS